MKHSPVLELTDIALSHVPGPEYFVEGKKLSGTPLYSGGFASTLSSPLCLTQLLVRLVGCRS
jgi:hypothetical protein